MSLADRFDPHAAVARRERFAGLRWDVVTDDIALPDGTVARDYVRHPGAVGIVALDDDDRVLLVQQYRHPVGHWLWEPPAGLMDVADEPAWSTARRELLEEAGMIADDWHVLADWFNSPGGSSEAFRCFLARGLHPAPGGRPHGEAEEADMPIRWLPLTQAVDLVLAGRLANPTAVTGILAAATARARGWQGLRPADAPWDTRRHLVTTDRVRLPDASA